MCFLRDVIGDQVVEQTVKFPVDYHESLGMWSFDTMYEQYTHMNIDISP